MNRTTAILMVCAILQLPGCGTLPEGSRSGFGALIAEQRAERAEANGEYQVAAREYIKLASSSEAPAKADYYLRAAAAYVRGKHYAQAQQVLKELDPIERSAAQIFRGRLLTAQITLAERDPQQALTLLSGAPPPELPAELQIELHRVRAQAFELMGNHLEAARERVALEAFLSDPDEILANQRELWQALENLSPLALKNLRLAPPPDVLSGWLELAYIARTSQHQPATLGERIIEWRERYPLHPASDEFVASLLARQQEITFRPQNVALLLPLSGRFAREAAAVRDGFLTAYFTHHDAEYKPTIRVYDVEDDPSIVDDLYERAVANGADFVVGPLSRPGVEELVKERHLAVPTLVLNYAESHRRPPAGLFQFGLNPADEARLVAERAWLDGRIRAVVLAPEGEWGERVVAAFNERWKFLGGEVLDDQVYAPNENDFSQPLRALLNIDRSEARWKSLQAVLGTKLEFVPRRRQDVDFVFMAAFPRQARLIRPQLKFFYASDLPVYATSHVYSGTPDPTADRDLDDVIFCDLPWILGDDQTQRAAWGQIQKFWPDDAQQLRRLYALGYDAYNVIPHLDRMSRYSFERYAGATGSLRIGENGRIERQLVWAQFKGGRARPYGDMAFGLGSVFP